MVFNLTAKASSSRSHRSWNFVKIVSGKEHVFSELKLKNTKGASDMQRKSRAKYGKEAECRKIIYSWHNRFMSTACVYPKK